MKKTNSLLLSGLAMLSLVFAMSCSNPSAPEPQDKPEVEENPIISLVKGKKFIDASNSIYEYAEDGKSYTMTLASDPAKVFNYTYEVDDKVFTNTSENGYGGFNKFTYKCTIDGSTLKLTEGKVIGGADTGFPATMDLVALESNNIDLFRLIKGKTFIDGTNSLYTVDEKGDSYVMTLNSNGSEYTYNYKINPVAKTLHAKSDAGYKNVNDVTYNYTITGNTFTLTLPQTVGNAATTLEFTPYDLQSFIIGKTYKDQDKTSYVFKEDGKLEMGLGAKNAYKVHYVMTFNDKEVSLDRDPATKTTDDATFDRLIKDETRNNVDAVYTNMKAQSAPVVYTYTIDKASVFTLTPTPTEGTALTFTTNLDKKE